MPRAADSGNLIQMDSCKVCLHQESSSREVTLTDKETESWGGKMLIQMMTIVIDPPGLETWDLSSALPASANSGYLVFEPDLPIYWRDR